jgi:phage terminase large subunit-like protein
MSNDPLINLAESFLSGNNESVVDIITFVEAPWGLNFKLFPAQKFMLKCYYGLPLDGRIKNIEVPDVVNDRILFTFTEVEFLQWLYEEGRCNTNIVEGKIFRELILVIGRRSGKSTIASCISNYEMYKLIKRGDPSAYYSFPPDSQVAILNVAPTDPQAGVVFGMIRGMTSRCNYLQNRVLNSTQNYFNISTDTDLKSVGKKKASIISMAGGCSSNSLRGRNSIVVIMDEFAFFIDNGGRFAGSEVYKALTPSTASFKRDGKVIVISSPYAKYGAFWDRYNESFDEEESTLMFKMYTPMVNPTIDKSILKAERKRDKIGFIGEYGAEFSDSVVAWIDDEDVFKSCIPSTKVINAKGREDVVYNKVGPERGVTGVRYYAGIDLGLKNDGTAISIVHREGKKIILDYAKVWYSGSSDVWDFQNSIYKDCGEFKDDEYLKIRDIIKEIKEINKLFPVYQGFFDQHNGAALMEMLHEDGLTQFEMEHVSDTSASKIYNLAKTLYQDQLLELFYDPVLIPELLSLEAEKRSKQKIIVRGQTKKGAHDDVSDAYIRAVWACYQDSKDKSANVATNRFGVVRKPSVGAKGASVNTFALNKEKAHGAHPRLGSVRSRKGRR